MVQRYGDILDGKRTWAKELAQSNVTPTLIGEEFAQELIDYTDKIYLEFGADPHVRASTPARRSRRSARTPSTPV